MKRWVALTVLVYLLALVLLTVPVVALAFGGWGAEPSRLAFGQSMHLFLHGGYWLRLAVLGAAQALLLVVPLKIHQRQFIPRRTLKIPCVVTAFLVANLCFATLLDAFCVVFQQEGLDAFAYLIPFNLSPGTVRDIDLAIAAFTTLLALWTIWTILFRHFADSDDPDSLVKRITCWLIAGSILELLVAIPCHVAARRREDLGPAFGTFWGIATGLSILLLAFGPAIFFRFARRSPR